MCRLCARRCENTFIFLLRGGVKKYPQERVSSKLIYSKKMTQPIRESKTMGPVHPGTSHPSKSGGNEIVMLHTSFRSYP